MYNRYEFNIDPRNCLVIGDLHGEWGLLKYKIRESGMRDSILIVAGDCGFGFEKKEFYNQTYNKMVKVLREQNVTVIFVRGNHDQKSYFDGEKIDFEYWKAVPDYSVLSLTNNYNILCVGGGISIDRLWRKAEEKKSKSGKRYYWTDEIPIYDPEILDKIKEDGVEIRTLITHSSPSFAPLTDKHGIQSFILYDKALIEDIANERMVMTKLYDHLVKKDKHPLKLNVHGHFHQHSLFYTEEDVKIIMLDMCIPRNNSWDIYPLER